MTRNEAQLELRSAYINLKNKFFIYNVTLKQELKFFRSRDY